MILDSEDKIIASNKKAESEEIYKGFVNNNDAGEFIKQEEQYKKQKSIVQFKNINGVQWKILSIIPISEITGDMKLVFSLGIWFTIIMLLLLMGIGGVFIYNSLHPIMVIARFLRKTGEYNIKQRLNVTSSNEVGMIAKDINEMLDKVENMTRKIVETQAVLYEAELARTQAELSALQNQINPHFLYNTLNCLSGIGLAHNVMEVADICSAMSRIFRYNIKGHDIVYIKDEINCIKDYLLIMDIRYQGKFKTVIDIEEDILNCTTMKMIFQPIVENAIYHGLERKNSLGHLWIKGCIKDQNYLQFEIKDDGVGIQENELKEVQQHINMIHKEEENGANNVRKSMGMVNINKRIKYQFGHEYGLDIQSIEGQGTKVIVKIPILYDVGIKGKVMRGIAQ